MSFDIFLQFHRNGELATVPQAMVEKAFEPFVKNVSDLCWLLSFPDGGFCELYGDNGVETSGFMVARPPAYLGFWTALIDIMRQAPSVLFWPGGPPVVVDAAAIPHLPPDMVVALGAPVVAATPAEIKECIRRS